MKLKMHDFEREARLTLLSLGVYVSYLSYGYFQERSFSQPVLSAEDNTPLRLEASYLALVCAANALAAWSLLRASSQRLVPGHTPHGSFCVLAASNLCCLTWPSATSRTRRRCWGNR